MSTLIVDVMVEILIKLQVKPLLRFRCLSKEFSSIIDGPYFIKRHLRKGFLHHHQRLIVTASPRLFSVDLDSADNAFQLNLPISPIIGNPFSAVGSCDGLLALSDCLCSTLCLWNMSTKKHQILPTFWRFHEYGQIYAVLADGFGYDVATDDYKWVKVLRFCAANLIEVPVYSLKTNSWRRIQDSPPYLHYNVVGVSAFVGGALNWLVIPEDVKTYGILSFDLKNEKFCEVLLPFTVQAYPDSLDIMVLGGCLCLSHFYENSSSDVWVMKEYGVKNSWSKLFTFSERDPGSTPARIVAVAYSKCGEKVLVYKENGQVLLHDLEKGPDEPVEVNGWPLDIENGTIYVETLVSPNINTGLGGFVEKRKWKNMLAL